MDNAVNRFLTVYEALISTQEHFHECPRSPDLTISVAHYAEQECAFSVTADLNIPNSVMLSKA